MKRIGSIILTRLCAVIILLAICILPASVMAQPNPSSSDMPNPLALTDMFVDVNVPSHRIYLGETIRIEYDVYISIARGELKYDYHEPDFTAWYVYEAKTPKDSFITLGNKKYKKEPFAVYYISALQVGDIEVPSLEVTAPFEKPAPWIASAPHTIEVMVPQPPYPPDFDLHNIGEFEVKQIVPDQLMIGAGEIVEHEFIISGNAPTYNISPNDAYINKLKSIYGDALIIYPLNRTSFIEEIRDDKYYSETHLSAKVVATKPGNYTFPPLTLMTFNPSTQKYELKQTEEFTLEVYENGYNYKAPKLTSPLEIETLQPRQLNLLRDSHVPLIPFWIAVLPPLVFAAVFGSEFMRKHRLKKEEQRKHAQNIQELYDTLQSSTSADQQLVCFRKLLILILHIEADHLMHLDIQMLCDSGLATTDALNLSTLYNTISHANYSKQAPLSPEQTKEIARLLQQINATEKAS